MYLCRLCNEKLDNWKIPYYGGYAHRHCIDEQIRINKDKRMEMIFKIERKGEMP